jgi:hypothetical protein
MTMLKEAIAMRAGIALTMLALLCAGGLMGLLAGCNDTAEEEMYQQMTAGGDRDGSSATPRTSRDDLALPGTEAATAEGDTEAPQEPVLVVTLEDETEAGEKMLTVEAPYPEFDGEGRYDIKVAIMVEEYSDPQVYRIVALNADGEAVGEQQRHLQLPMKKPRSLDLNNFYCTSMPVAIEFYSTDKEAIAAGETEAEASGRPGSGAPPSAGVGRGLAGASGDGGGDGSDEEDEEE